MGIRSDLDLSRRPAAGLAACGLFWGAIAGWLPDIKARAGVSDAEFGALMMLAAVGGMVSMAFAPRLRARFGARVLPVAALTMMVAAILPALPQTPGQLGLVLLIVGLTMSLTDILSNIRLSEIEARAGRSLMNLNHALFSLGLALSAAAMGLLRRAAVPHWAAVMGLIMVLGVLVLMLRGGAASAGQTEQEGQDGRSAPWWLILPGAAILWLCFIAENGTESWAAIHIERTLGAAGGIGAFGPAMFALAMGLARLAGQIATQILGEVRLIGFSVILGFAGAVALAAAPGLTIAIAGTAALGLGVAVVVPTTNSLIGRSVAPDQRASAISRAWILGFTGFFIGPPLMGLVSEWAGLRMGFALIAVLVALMLPCLWLLARRLN